MKTFLEKFLKHAAPDQTGSGTVAGLTPQQVQAIGSQIAGTQDLRDLPIVTYTGTAGIQSLQIPNNSSYKSAWVTLSGFVTVTYASGSPVLSPLTFFSRICAQIDVKASANRTVKSLDLHMLRNMNALYYGGFPKRAFATGASLRNTSSEGTTEVISGTFAMPATTQDIIVNEAVRIDFEHPHAWRDKAVSQLFCRDLTDPRMYFTFLDISNIQQDGGGVSVSYSNVNFTIQVSLLEDRQATQTNNSYDFVETILQDQLPAAANNRRFSLNAGQRVLGLSFLTRQGDTNSSLSNRLITALAIRTNGTEPHFEGNFRSIQFDNKCRYGVSDDQLSSGNHGLKGFAHISFIKDGDLKTGLDARPDAGVQTLDLIYSTTAASGVDAQTYPANVKILQQTFVPVIR